MKDYDNLGDCPRRREQFIVLHKSCRVLRVYSANPRTRFVVFYFHIKILPNLKSWWRTFVFFSPRIEEVYGRIYSPHWLLTDLVVSQNAGDNRVDRPTFGKKPQITCCCAKRGEVRTHDFPRQGVSTSWATRTTSLVCLSTFQRPAC